MVTLTTDLGEFQAKTPEEAAKMARKAARDAAREHQRREADRQQAFLLARVQAYHIYDWKATHPTWARGWWFIPRDSQWFPKQTVEDYCYTATPVTTDESYGKLLLYDCGWEVVGLLRNGAGIDMAVFVRDCHGSDQVQTWALGCHNHEVGYVRVFGVTMDEFKKGGEA